jgi:hypothetical protein
MLITMVHQRAVLIYCATTEIMCHRALRELRSSPAVLCQNYKHARIHVLVAVAEPCQPVQVEGCMQPP